MSTPAFADFFGVAHRGGRKQAPENTLEVFQLTIALGVTPWLETDSWESSDGVLVLHHDRSLCRTTNIETLPGYDCEVAANNPLGRFPEIRDFTLAELKALDVGSWFSPEYVGTQMPTLEEALTLVDGTGVPLLVEIKRPGQAPIIAEILSRTGLSPDNLIIWTREVAYYDDFHDVLPGVRQMTGFTPSTNITEAFLADRAAKGDLGIGIAAVGLTKELVDLIHSYGLITYSIPLSNGQDPLLDQIPLGIDAFHTPDELNWASFLSTRPCIDRIDNDGDGFADFDGIDYDFDGTPEVLPDPGCSERLATSEVAECQDMLDNDGDGLVDLADPECLTPNTVREASFYCGDMIVTAPETCDDGNTTSGDGCYSNCRVEDARTIYGVAVGGSATVTISGVAVMVTTSSGETATQVAANLAAAVNADATLQSMDLSAVALGASLYTDGSIDSLILMDLGLSNTPIITGVPALMPMGWTLLALGLLLLAMFHARRPPRIPARATRSDASPPASNPS